MIKLVDALKDGTITWDDLEPYREVLKSFEVGDYIITRESHELDGYKGKAFAVEILTKDYDPIDSFSWFEWKEVNSIKKLKEITGI